MLPTDRFAKGCLSYSPRADHQATGVRRVGSVSYTHLDVYKRQSQRLPSRRSALTRPTIAKIAENWTRTIVTRTTTSSPRRRRTRANGKTRIRWSSRTRRLKTLRFTQTCLRAVSYTHLDVYKRQLTTSPTSFFTGAYIACIQTSFPEAPKNWYSPAKN